LIEITEMVQVEAKAEGEQQWRCGVLKIGPKDAKSNSQTL